MATNKVGRRDRDTQTALHAPNILPDIVLVDGNLEEAAFLAWLLQLEFAATFNNKFSFYEDDWLPLTDTVNGAVTGTTQKTIVVDTPLAFLANHLWKNTRTGEGMFAESVNEPASTVTFARGVGRDSTNSTGTTATAILDGDTLVRLGATAGEVSRRQTAQSTVPVEVFNYTEKMRYEVDMSDWQEATEHITGNDWEYQLDKAFEQARKDLNGKLIMGERNTATVNGQKHFYTGGLDTFISSNTLSVSGTLHEYALNDFLAEKANRFGSTDKLCLGSSKFITAINEIAGDKVVIQRANLGVSDIALGVNVLKYVSPSGKTLTIMEDRFLSSAYPGHAYIVDMQVVRIRHFSNSKKNGMPHFMENTQENDADNMASAIIMDLGLEVGPEKHHARITGVTSGGAAGRAVG